MKQGKKLTEELLDKKTIGRIISEQLLHLAGGDTFFNLKLASSGAVIISRVIITALIIIWGLGFFKLKVSEQRVRLFLITLYAIIMIT